MGGVVVALLAATVGVLTVTAAPVSATTVSVATEQEYRDALDDLSSDITVGPHVIDITADFTITLAGDPTYTGTQPLTINGNGHTIDGGGTHSVLFHNTGQALTINNLTLTNGKSTGGNSGGAILSAQGSVTVTGSTFTNNTAGGSGGAISSFRVGDGDRQHLHRQHRRQRRGGHRRRRLGGGDRQHLHRQHRQQLRGGHLRRRGR